MVVEGVVTLTMPGAARPLDVLELHPFEVVSGGHLMKRPERCSAVAKTPTTLLAIAATAYTEFLGAAVLTPPSAPVYTQRMPSTAVKFHRCACRQGGSHTPRHENKV